MNKIIKNKFKFHWSHILALFILGGYFFLSKVNMVHALTKGFTWISFFQLYFFGVFFGTLLLYVLSHENFFPFAKDIKKEEQQKEKALIKKYVHHGKILAVFIIGVVAGPVFSALTTRLLLNKFKFKYLILIITNLPSTILTFGISQGFIHLFNF